MTLKDFGLVVVIILNSVAMVSCFGMIHQGERQACAARWADSGMASRWKDGAGCLVEHKPGLWVNESFLKGQLQ